MATHISKTSGPVTWEFCPLCDPFGELTEAYLAHSVPTVRVAESGVGYCLACGLRVDERPNTAQKRTFDA